jgi:large repetitive protein
MKQVFAKNQNNRAHCEWAWLFLFLLFCVSLVLPTAPSIAAPPQGTAINNQARADFVETQSGKTVQLDSNVVAATVDRIASFTLTQSQNLISAAGASVSFQHTVINNGNATEPFAVVVQDNYPGTFAFSSVAIFADANNDGIADSLTPITQTPPIAPGDSFRFVVVAAVPNIAGVATEDRFTVIAAPVAGGAAQQTNVDTVTITNNAVMVVNKEFSVTSGPSPFAGLGVTLTYRNIGNTTARNVVIRDTIGAAMPTYNTQGLVFVPNSVKWQGQLVQDNANLPGFAMVVVNSNGIATISAAIDSVAPGASGTLSFVVDVKPGLPAGTAATTNQASTSFFDGVAPQTVLTNNTAFYSVVSGGIDLAISKSHVGNFSAGVEGRFLLQVRNVGAAPSVGMITVTDTMPAGMRVVATSLAALNKIGWSCLLSTNANVDTVTCTSDVSIGPGASHNYAITIPVIPEAQTIGQSLTNIARLSGGGDTELSATNNQARDTFTVTPSAALSGYAWFDANHNGKRDSDEPPGVNIIVELRDVNDQLVATTRTQNDGSYSFAAVAPGSGYKLLFRYPDGSKPIAGSPIVGENGAPEFSSSTSVVTGASISNLTLAPGNKVVRQNLRLDPSGVIYDAQTRQPVAGAIVRVEGPAGFDPAVHLLGGLENVEQITGASGLYQYVFLQGAPAGVYRLQVTAPAGYAPGTSKLLVPAVSRNCGELACLDPTGLAPQGAVYSIQPANIAGAPPLGQDTTYYLAFALDLTTDPELVNNHIPLDPVGLGLPGLILEKTVNRNNAEVGDHLIYKVRFRNTTRNTMTNVTVTDALPLGFKYARGSARFDNIGLPDPERLPDGQLRFSNLGSLAPEAAQTLTYVVQLAPGAQLGDGINRARARAGQYESNTASAKVTVQGGVFDSRGILLGKVFVDCNNNHVQDPEEIGIPGVRLYLQDGSFVVTDSEGKYSIAGLRARSHVIKLDSTTLPVLARIASISNRNMLDGNSRLVDMRNGELQRADFAETSCSNELMKSVIERRRRGEVGGVELFRAVQSKLETLGVVAPVDPRTAPATGFINVPESEGFSLLGGLERPALRPALPNANIGATTIAATPVPTATATRNDIIEAILRDSDNSLAILGLKDGDTLPIAQVNLAVKGNLEATLELLVNGEPVSAQRIGVKSELAAKQLQYLEFIGVVLKPGSNEVTLQQRDSFGNLREKIRLNLIAPDQPGKILMGLSSSVKPIADGRTPVQVNIRIVDSNGTPVSARTPITLEANGARWQVEDMDPAEPGIQTFVQGGKAQLALLPPLSPGDTLIRVTSGVLKTDFKVAFLPELRPMIAAGVIEGMIRLRNPSVTGVFAASRADGFEEELRALSRSSDHRSFAGRAAFFLKGKVRGDYLLTLAYDSEKTERERLLRDIRPDEFYPVYGDSSIKGFDAQSTRRLYLRVDKDKSYLLWGDFNTATVNPAQMLSQYQRTLSGLRHHYEVDWLTVDSFATKDSLRQVVKELPANGTSGPFDLGSVQALANSEKVEVIVRDRFQPAQIVKSILLVRFIDYSFEPLTGRILLRGPQASVDANLNPISLRITFEVDQGGDSFWVYGANARARVNEKLTVGAGVVVNKNPLPENFERMANLNASVQLAEKTVIHAELAQTQKTSGLQGNAARIELSHETDQFAARAVIAKAEKEFDNPSSITRSGVTDAALKLAYKITPQFIVQAEGLISREQASDTRRTGVLAQVQYNMTDTTKLEVGARQRRDVSATADTSVTSVRIKATTAIPATTNGSLYGELEQDVKDKDKRLVAIGADYQFAQRAKLYARHEFVSSLPGGFSLTAPIKNNQTIVGVSGDYMNDGSLFAEYRGRDAFGTRTTEAAIGLRNLFTVWPGWRLNTNLERVKALSGSADQESKAIALGLDYVGSERLKGSTRVELRDATTTRSTLFTADLASKLSRDWTLLGRHIDSRIHTKGTESLTGSDRNVQRFRLGTAYRPVDTNHHNALAMIERKIEKDSSAAATAPARSVVTASVHSNWQPARAVVVSSQFATKWASDTLSNLNLRSHVSLVGARATYEFTEHWDLSAQVSVMRDHRNRVTQRGLGFEIGYLVKENMWLSLGANLSGYRDTDLVPGNINQKGLYLRLRLKFDEDLFGGTNYGQAATGVK